MITKEEIAMLISSERKARRLSRERLARLTDLSTSTIISLEKGIRAAGYDTLDAVLNAFDMHIEIVKNNE